MQVFHPTADIATLLGDIQNGIRSVLGDDFVGLYLFGSLVYGDFTPDVSDIDLLAVTRRVVTETDIDRLREMHSDLARHHPAWDDRIEVAYQSLRGLRTFMTERSPMGIISPGEPLHMIEAGSDWLMNWYFVLDHGVTLVGPPPESIIAPIPHDVFVASCRSNARRLAHDIHSIADQRGESYAILTFCRALYTHITGQHVSKQTAARWLQGRHPEWSPLIDMALERRVSDVDNGPVDTHAHTVHFIDMVMNELHDMSAPNDDA